VETTAQNDKHCRLTSCQLQFYSDPRLKNKQDFDACYTVCNAMHRLGLSVARGRGERQMDRTTEPAGPDWAGAWRGRAERDWDRLPAWRLQTAVWRCISKLTPLTDWMNSLDNGCTVCEWDYNSVTKPVECNEVMNCREAYCAYSCLQYCCCSRAAGINEFNVLIWRTLGMNAVSSCHNNCLAFNVA